jgi:hypothetical protein
MAISNSKFHLEVEHLSATWSKVVLGRSGLCFEVDQVA